MKIGFSCVIQESDFKRATWIDLRPRKAFAVVGILLLLLAIMLLGYFSIQYVKTGKGLSLVIQQFGSLVAIYLLVWVWVPRRLNRVYQYLLGKRISILITDTELVSDAGAITTTLSWDAFRRWKCDNSMIVLYQNEGAIHFFPRRGFASADEFQTFRALLVRRFGSPAA